MKTLNLLLAATLSTAIALGAPHVLQAAQDKNDTTKADNTRKNREENKGATADQQKENKTDREITREIRRTVVKDKSLSITAHNVKIITKDGRVILKGPVKSEDEKKAVEKAAVAVVGKGKVSNELEVAPPKDKTEKKEKKEQKEQK
ncbi:BON domain-containing protein [Geomonas sp. Red69]|uniref:BON domain-containing protein n=1 Tax=Geomonas diazotrophica TaxID=2843197 RepID=A0ABX8JM26_9BACT|nr:MULTISPECIES: BON domain-containing protein [Geomonas]MBU5636784.1 BON domain-containing protein [Geomonas diazotrophica]QWV98407.1 BON domain-containing protein [Geomonas nitrogeniifigens]QXE87589.1 BON domain-containing protein [Geomonas nitrogeniifigens]